MLVIHMTFPCDCNFIPYQDFGYRAIDLHESRAYGIPDIPMPDEPLPCMLAFPATPTSM
jgi:hypothetical protein